MMIFSTHIWIRRTWLQKAFIRIGVLLALTGLCWRCEGALQNDMNKEMVPFSQNSVPLIDSLIAAVRDSYGVPGLAAAIVQGDSVYTAAVGIRNEEGSPLLVTTPIHAGTLSEPMLAYATLLLERSGKIDLEDKVVTHLPYFKMQGESYKLISIRHLLTHSSGIENYTLFYDSPSFNPNAPETTTRSIGTQRPRWQLPEIQVLRSAYNYDILSDLINKVTGQPFEAYVRETVFKRLGMADSYFHRREGAAEPFYTTDYLDYSYRRQPVYPYNREHGGSRGLHISAKDLGHWLFNVLHGDNPIFFSKELNTSGHTAVGFGWEIVTDTAGYEIYTKESAISGFTGQLIAIPSLKIGVGVLANINSDLDVSRMATVLTSWLRKRETLMLKMPVHIPMAKQIKTSRDVASSLCLFRKLKRDEPEAYDFSATSLLQLAGNLLHREKHTEQAIELLRFCSEEFLRSAQVPLRLAEAYLEKEDLMNCRLQIQKAWAAPDDTTGRWTMVRFLEEKMEMVEEQKRLPIPESPI